MTRIQLRPTPFQTSLLLSFVLPAVILNPVLFLHSLNAILSRVLPPIVVPNTTTQPPAYYPLGPSAEHPHVDIHASDSLCWVYTTLMLVAQLVAFQLFKMPSNDTNTTDQDTDTTESESESPCESTSQQEILNPFTVLTSKPKTRSSLSLAFSALLWAINLSYNAYRKHSRDEIGGSLGNDTRVLVGLDNQLDG